MPKEQGAIVRITRHLLSLNQLAALSSQTWTKQYDAKYSPDATGNWKPKYHGDASLYQTDPVYGNAMTQYQWSEADPLGTQQTETMAGSFGPYPLTGEDWQVRSVPHQSLDHEEHDITQSYYYYVHHYYAKGVRHSFPAGDGNEHVVFVAARTVETLFTGGKAGVARKALFSLSAVAWEYGQPQNYPWSYTRGWPVPAAASTVGGKAVGADNRAYLVLPNNTPVDLTVKIKGEKHFTASAGATKHKLRIIANGCPLQPDRVVNCAKTFWVGNRLDFTPLWTPEVPGIASKTVKWVLDGKFVNDTWQRSRTEWVGYPPSPSTVHYGSVNYFKNPDLLMQENTGGWWVSGNYDPPAEYSAQVGVNLTFANGQQAVVTADGKFNMWRPKFIENNMCQDRANPSLAAQPPDYPCLFVHEAPTWVWLGKDIGGYARFWASFRARPGDKFTELQIVKSYRQWGGNSPISSGQDWWFDGEGAKTGGSPGGVAGVDGIGVVQQTDKFPGIPKEAPSYQLNDTFKTYMRYLPQEPGSIAITLGRADWAWSVTGQFINGQWSPSADSISEPSWNEVDEFPDWVDTTLNH